MPSGQRVGGGFSEYEEVEWESCKERSEAEQKTVILIDDGNRRLMDVLAAKGYGVVHLAAKDVNPGMLVCLISDMSMSRRKTALIADIARQEADAVAHAIWELFPDTRVVIVDKDAKRTRHGVGSQCDMIVPNTTVKILKVLEGYRTVKR